MSKDANNVTNFWNMQVLIFTFCKIIVPQTIPQCILSGKEVPALLVLCSKPQPRQNEMYMAKRLIDSRLMMDEGRNMR